VLTGAQDRTARLWDLSSGRLVRIFGGGDFILYSIESASFSPDGRYLAATTEFQKARVWEVETGKLVRVLSGHESWVKKIAYSPDGRSIATASADGTVRIWDAWVSGSAWSGRPTIGDAIGVLVGHRHVIDQVAWSRDGTRLLTGSLDRTARVWDPNMDHQRLALISPAGAFTSARYTPDGTIIATGSTDNTARLWEAATGREIAVLAGHSAMVDDAVFAAGGRLLATYSADGTIRLWDASTHKLMHVLNIGSRVRGVAPRPDGSQLVSWSDDKILRVWEIASGKEVRRLEGHTNFIQDVEWSPDGARIVTASMDKTARMFSGDTGQQLAVFTGHSAFVNTASFSADGQRIVTSSWDGTARVWNAGTGDQLLVLGGHADRVEQAWFSPDDAKIVTASADGSMRLWSSITGELLNRIVIGSGVISARFSRDGSRLVTADLNFGAHVWDVATGAEIATVSRHRGPLHTVDFSPDGRRFLTSSVDGSARVFDAPSTIDAPSAVLVGRARAVRPLSEGDRHSYFLDEDFEVSVASRVPASRCDQLAANPYDPLKLSKGIPLNALPAQAAIDECTKAVEAEPQTPRYRYQLGRALEATRQFDEARARYEQAVAAEYPAAFMNLGMLYLNGRGVQKDATRAAELLRKAFSTNVVVAGGQLATALSESPDQEMRDESNRIWTEAARRGDPLSMLHFAKASEGGGGAAAAPLGSALKLYAAAEWLFDKAGDRESAAQPRARRATIARALPADQVARTWVEVEAEEAALKDLAAYKGHVQ
jgi:WD40 repeat protein